VSSRRSAAILQRWAAAYSAHDIEALLGMADPKIDIVPLGYTVTAPPGTSYHGHAGLRSLLEPAFQRYPRLRMELEGDVAVGSATIVQVTMILDDGDIPPVRRRCGARFSFTLA
jgi:hypothetical protein